MVKKSSELAHTWLSMGQVGRSWQPLGESKNGHKTFVKRIFAIFGEGPSWLRTTSATLQLNILKHLSILHHLNNLKQLSNLKQISSYLIKVVSTLGLTNITKLDMKSR